jgi:hypothetical protein
VGGAQDAGPRPRAGVAGRDLERGGGRRGHRGMVEAVWCSRASSPSRATSAIRCSSP